jgi:hypothetical protein
MASAFAEEARQELQIETEKESFGFLAFAKLMISWIVSSIKWIVAHRGIRISMKSAFSCPGHHTFLSELLQTP